MTIYGVKEGNVTPPNDAVYLSLTGDDHNDGGIHRPVGSLQEALRRAPLNGFVAVYGDTFTNQENCQQIWRKPVTIASVPGERALFRGSDAVYNWEIHSAGIWKRTNWYTNFDHTPASPVMATRKPWATWPEQVWVGGRPLRRTEPGVEMRPGEFSYNQADQTMYISSDPEEGVRIAVRSCFLTGSLDNETGNHPTLNLFGIDVEEWATLSTQYGAVRLAGHNSLIANTRFRGCSAAGLFVQQGRNIDIWQCEFKECGQLGLSGYQLKDLIVAYSIINDNNLKEFDSWQVAGGAKISNSSLRTKLRYNYISRNRGHGAWLDLGCTDSELIFNVGIGHIGHSALMFEMGSGCKVLSNYLEGNTIGTLISEAGDVEVAYNTYVNNTKHTKVQRGPRPDDRDWLPYNHPQANYDIHSNMYVQNIQDNNVTFNGYEDPHGAQYTWQEVNWGSDYNWYRRVPATGNAAVLTTDSNQRQPFPGISDVESATGNEENSGEVILDTEHDVDSKPKRGRRMSNAVAMILGVTDEEAQEPNIGWYGPEYVPDEPEEPEPMTLAEQLHSIELDVAELESNYAAQTVELEQAHTELLAANEALSAANTTITERDATIADLNEGINLLNEQIADLQAQLAECCPEEEVPVGLEERLAPVRGYHRLGGHAKPGTLAAFASLQNIIGSDAPMEGRRVFNSGDLDWTIDTAAGRIPIVEVPLGSNYETFTQKAIDDDKPVVFTLGHEEERPEKNHTATWFKENYEDGFHVLKWAPKAIIIHTWMLNTVRGNTAGVTLSDWLPAVELAHGVGVDIYVGNPLNQPFNSQNNVLTKPLQLAHQLGVPLFVPEFGVGGPMVDRAAWVVGYLNWMKNVANGSQTVSGITPEEAHLYTALLSIWYHSNLGGSPPMTFDGTPGWEINKASDQMDTQTPAVWKYGILTNGV